MRVEARRERQLLPAVRDEVGAGADADLLQRLQAVGDEPRARDQQPADAPAGHLAHDEVRQAAGVERGGKLRRDHLERRQLGRAQAGAGCDGGRNGRREGREVLEQFFALDGTRRLGEVALVDENSPVSKANVVFYEILFDENAACHVAFGEAYPDGVIDGSKLSEDELRGLGVNKADAHLDVMIGNATMRLTGICEDGSEVLIMERGEFVPAVTQGVPA